MNNKIKTLAALTALSAMAFGLYSTVSLATPDPIPAKNLVPAQQSVKPLTLVPAKNTLIKIRRVKVKVVKRQHPAWRLGLSHNKNLSIDNARTITKAALLMKGRKDLSVGKIKPSINRKGRKVYMIQLVNAKHKVVSSILLNSKNGHIRPLRSQQPALKLQPARS